MNHKWDIITDKCIKCGVLHRVKQLYTKDGFFKCGKLAEYFIDGEWTTENPGCVKIKNER